MLFAMGAWILRKVLEITYGLLGSNPSSATESLCGCRHSMAALGQTLLR